MIKSKNIPNNRRYANLITASLFAITCSVVSLAGLAGGIMFGITYFTGLPGFSTYGYGYGYEGPGMLGGFVGSAIISLIMILLWFKKSPLLKKLLISFIVYWIIMVVIQDIIAAYTAYFSFLLYLSPTIFTGITYIYLRSKTI